ncbi:HNH endonuclease [Acinetobacter baumannii]
MALQADLIRSILINEYGFKAIKQRDGSEFDKVYKLQHIDIDHLVIINRKLKNAKILALPLKYHIYEDHLNKLHGIEIGNISHHSGHKDFWEHLGTSPYNASNQKEPPAQYYGFSTEESLRSFMSISFKLANKNTDEFIETIAPDDVDDSFDESILPTERQALIKARIGQGAYRKALLDYWGGRAVTGCAVEALLVSSHIKPWSVDKDARLDPFNGLLLSPTLDRAFDQRLISFNDDGSIILSPVLTETDMKLLHLDSTLRLRKVDPRHLPYLAWHRANLVKE